MSDVLALNDFDRLAPAVEALARLPQLETRCESTRRDLGTKLAAHRAYIRDHGEDLPGIRDWRWPNGRRQPS